MSEQEPGPGQLRLGYDPADLERVKSAVARQRHVEGHMAAAVGKGQVALLVTDAAGVVIAGVRGTGGMTKFFMTGDGILHASVHLGRVEVLEGSYVLQDMGDVDLHGGVQERLELEPPG